jgi:hypothetical protein
MFGSVGSSVETPCNGAAHQDEGCRQDVLCPTFVVRSRTVCSVSNHEATVNDRN